MLYNNIVYTFTIFTKLAQYYSKYDTLEKRVHYRRQGSIFEFTVGFSSTGCPAPTRKLAATRFRTGRSPRGTNVVSLEPPKTDAVGRPARRA